MKGMQRFIVGILGIAVVIAGFFLFVSTQPDHPLKQAILEVLPGNGTSATATATTAPEGPAPEQPAQDVPQPEAAAETPAKQALAALDTVELTTAARIPDYDRDLFGDSWEDVDHNGCDTRNDILARDMTVTAKDGTCRVLTGVLADPYTGTTINFVRGEQTSQAVQIDHTVALSAAWKAGAWEWTADERLQFANDPTNLHAVDGPTNNGKSDKGPARWMPSTVGNPGYDCQYATDYTTVLVKYDLSAPSEDLTTLRNTLALCA